MRRFFPKAVLVVICTIFRLAAQSGPAEVKSPGMDSDLLKQAVEAFRAGNLEAAVAKYQAVLAENPKSVDAYAGLTRSYLKQEKIGLAFETGSKAVSLLPDSASLHAALGEVYFRQAKMVEAEKQFLQGVNTVHPQARAFLGLERLYDAYSFHARARKMLEKAHALDPDDPEIQKEWLYTLSRAERIKWLEGHLAGGNNNDDKDEREELKIYLDVLRARASRGEDLSCRLVSKVSSAEAQLRPLMLDPTHLHGFGLKVNINDHSSTLLLDTGSSGLLINKRLAEKAGVQRVVASKVFGIGDKGAVDSYLGLAKSIKIGGLEFQNCLVEVSDKRSVLDDDGLIGADVFDHYLVSLDFLWWKLKLDELPHRPGDSDEEMGLASQVGDDEAEDDSADTHDAAKPGDTKDPGAKPKSAAKHVPHDAYVAPEMKEYTKVFRFGHELLIPTRIGTSDSKLFLIDSGSMFNLISPEAARETTKVHRDNDTEVRGLSGKVSQVFSADKATLEFSHFRQPNEDVTSFDMSNISRSTGTEVSGILGFTTLRQFTLRIDYRDGLVDFVYTGTTRH